MVRMISAHTGTVMWVHEDRLEEYLERGHTLAPPPPPPPVSKSDHPRKRSTTKKTEK